MIFAQEASKYNVNYPDADKRAIAVLHHCTDKLAAMNAIMTEISGDESKKKDKDDE